MSPMLPLCIYSSSIQGSNRGDQSAFLNSPYFHRPTFIGMIKWWLLPEEWDALISWWVRRRSKVISGKMKSRELKWSLFCPQQFFTLEGKHWHFSFGDPGYRSISDWLLRCLWGHGARKTESFIPCDLHIHPLTNPQIYFILALRLNSPMLACSYMSTKCCDHWHLWMCWPRYNAPSTPVWVQLLIVEASTPPPTHHWMKEGFSPGICPQQLWPALCHAVAFTQKKFLPADSRSKRGKFSGPQRGGQAIISASAQGNPVKNDSTPGGLEKLEDCISISTPPAILKICFITKHCLL